MVDDISEAPSTTFSRDGKSTEVQIVSEKRIGSGHHGLANEAEVLVEGRKPWKFVIKRYWDSDMGTAQENAQQAMKNYEAAKKAGLKVFRTFRLGEDGTNILMTNGNNAEVVCIGKEVSLPDFEIPKLQPFSEEDLDALYLRMLRQIDKACAHRIFLHGDSYFFTFNKDTKDIDIVIGDLDRVGRRYSPGNLERSNIVAAQAALKNFVQRNVEAPENNLDMITDFVNSTMYHRELINT